MGMYKTLKAGESLSISGASVITAISKCKLNIEAAEEVNISSLRWVRGASSGHWCATGDKRQAYIVYDGGASFYEYVNGLLTEHPIYKGDRPKEFCEIHNMEYSK